MDILTIRIDHYHHIVSWSADTRIDAILALLKDQIMPTVQQVKDALAVTQADVVRETSVIQASITKTNGDAAVIADLTKQLADAKAALAAAGSDVTGLQDVIDGLTAVHTTMKANADADAAAIVANTPAA